MRLNRREVVAFIGGVIPGWAIAAYAEQPFRLGVLTGRGREEANFGAFFDELRQFGIIEGQQLAIDSRGFKAREDHFPALAANLVASGAHVILAAGDPAIKAAQAATREVPILGVADDMVGAGLVRSLARPGGNIAGISILATELNGKRLDLLMEALRGARRIAVLSDPRITTAPQLRSLTDAAQSRGVELVVCEAVAAEGIVPAIATASKAGAQGMNVMATALFSTNSQRIIEQTALLRLPAMYQWPEIADDGGLLAFGPRITLVYRQLARQLVKLMRGAKIADVPVEQPTVFELVVNLKTANALNLHLPETFLTRADQVIE